jgi:hypothetical protein
MKTRRPFKISNIEDIKGSRNNLTFANEGLAVDGSTGTEAVDAIVLTRRSDTCV